MRFVVAVPSSPLRSTMWAYCTVSPHGRCTPRLLEFFCCIMLRRSVFGLVVVYNKLPANIVASTSIRIFQLHLISMFKTSASNDVPIWQDMYSPI